MGAREQLAMYEEFVKAKHRTDPCTGIADIPALNPMLYPHQADMVRWALRRGRAALFADCGIGSTGYMAIKTGRKFVGSELKAAYFKQAAKNIGGARASHGGLFDDMEAA